ncbi:MAG: DODA-type extradiol aromatic ring-opening family dioxygenase [Acidimicrobiales bacterium]
MTDAPSRVLSIPHGGGPLPVMGDPSHQLMVDFLRGAEAEFGRPSAIVVVSAHWECQDPTLTAAPNPPLLYDYGGFPPETYQLQYPAPGDPELTSRIADMLSDAGFSPEATTDRGFDHGVFIPLLLMYPDATIPVVQLSLLAHLDPLAHIQMGAALQPLAADDILLVGSGFTFHNMNAFGPTHDASGADPENEAFERWLRETCTSAELSEVERTQRLVHWFDAPGARWAHPREEHLIPLHVCYGAGGNQPGSVIFNDKVLGKRASGYAW